MIESLLVDQFSSTVDSLSVLGALCSFELQTPVMEQAGVVRKHHWLLHVGGAIVEPR